MLNQIDRPASTLRITVGADGSARLEEHHVDVSTTFADHSPFRDDSITLGINPGRQCVDDFTVHGDHAGFDQGLTRPARRDPGIGQNLL